MATLFMPAFLPLPNGAGIFSLCCCGGGRKAAQYPAYLHLSRQTFRRYATAAWRGAIRVTAGRTLRYSSGGPAWWRGRSGAAAARAHRDASPALRDGRRRWRPGERRVSKRRRRYRYKAALLPSVSAAAFRMTCPAEHLLSLSGGVAAAHLAVHWQTLRLAYSLHFCSHGVSAIPALSSRNDRRSSCCGGRASGLAHLCWRWTAVTGTWRHLAGWRSAFPLADV